MTRRFIARAWPILGLAVLGLAFHARELAGLRPFARDTHLIFVPAKQFLAAHLARGELPQWWPWDGAGAPFLAQPLFSIFHPTTLLYAVLPFWGAFVGQDLLATFGAMLGAYLLARRLRQRPSSAFLAGALYGLCGYLSGLTEFSFSKLSAAAFPWYVWALLVADRRRGAWWGAPALAMGLLLLGGDPQIGLLAAALGFAVLVFGRRPTWRRAALGLGAPLLGAAIAAVQLLPAALGAGETERGGAMAYANTWALELRHLAGLVLPLDHGAWDFVPSTYVGPAALMLAAAAFAAHRRRLAWILLGASALSVWLALGDGAGLNALARRAVPFWAQFRYPIKSIIVFMLALPLLAGFGLQALQRARGRRRALAAAVAAGLLAVATALAWTGAMPDALWSLAALVTVIAALLAARLRAGAAVAAALVAAHLLAVVVPTRPMTGPELYEPSPLASAMRAVGVGLTGPAFDRIDTALRSPTDWAEAARAGGGGNASCFSALFELPTLTPSTAGASARVRRLFAEHAPELASRLAGVYGVGYLVVNGALPDRLASQVIARDERFDYSLLKLRNSLPRAYAAHRARVARDVNEALARVTSPEFRPGREIIVEAADPKPSEWENRPDTSAVQVPLDAASRDGDDIALRASLPWPGFVVLNEAAFSGWTATVDGTPAPVLVANAAMRAVEVPPGDHTVVFRYQTPGLFAGAALSCGALLVVVGGAALLAVRRRRGATGTARLPENEGPVS